MKLVAIIQFLSLMLGIYQPVFAAFHGKSGRLYDIAKTAANRETRDSGPKTTLRDIGVRLKNTQKDAKILAAAVAFGAIVGIPVSEAINYFGQLGHPGVAALVGAVVGGVGIPTSIIVGFNHWYHSR